MANEAKTTQAAQARPVGGPATCGTAYLGNEGPYTVFCHDGTRLKFVAPHSLERYVAVNEWDRGYLVVMAKYAHSEQPVEEYIDLVPILQNLRMDEAEFLDPIKTVEVER